jgi:hypothetical protein
MQIQKTQDHKVSQIKIDPETLMGQLSPYTCIEAAICELIDNSLDASANRIDIDFALDELLRTKLILADNGKGLGFDEIEKLYDHVRQDHAKGDIGKYSLGCKAARQHLSGHAPRSHLCIGKVAAEDHVNLATLNDNFEIDVKKAHDLKKFWEDLHLSPVAPDSGLITILRDIKGVDVDNFDAHLEDLRHHIGVTYCRHIMQKRIKIFLNKEEVEPIDIIGEQYLEHVPPREVIFKKHGYPDRKLTLSINKAPEKKNNKDKGYAGGCWFRNDRMISLYGHKWGIPYLNNPNYPMQLVLETEDDFDDEFNMTPGKELTARAKLKPALKRSIEKECVQAFHEICNVEMSQETEVKLHSSFNKRLNTIFQAHGIVDKYTKDSGQQDKSPVESNSEEEEKAKKEEKVELSNEEPDDSEEGEESGGSDDESGSDDEEEEKDKKPTRRANGSVRPIQFEKMGRQAPAFKYEVEGRYVTITMNSSKKTVSRMRKDLVALQEYIEEEVVPSILATESDEKARAARQQFEDAMYEKRQSMEECHNHPWSVRVLKDAIDKNAVFGTWYTINEIANWVAKDFPKVVKYKNNGLKQIKAELQSNFLSPSGIKKNTYGKTLTFKRNVQDKKICFHES